MRQYRERDVINKTRIVRIIVEIKYRPQNARCPVRNLADVARRQTGRERTGVLQCGESRMRRLKDATNSNSRNLKTDSINGSRFVNFISNDYENFEVKKKFLAFLEICSIDFAILF